MLFGTIEGEQVINILPEPFAAASERSAVYDLLARLWAKEIDAPLLDAMRSGDLHHAYQAAGGSPPQREALDDLQCDYCRLFLGPRGHLPPVQSVWEENRFEGRAATSLRQYLDMLGIELPFAAGLPTDHAGNCLGLFGRTLHQIGTLPELHNDADAADLMSALFRAHVQWIGELAEAAERHAETDFYRGLMAITRRFLNEEHDVLVNG